MALDRPEDDRSRGRSDARGRGLADVAPGHLGSDIGSSFREFAERSSVAFAVIDAATQRVRYANRAHRDLVGLSSAAAAFSTDSALAEALPVGLAEPAVGMLRRVVESAQAQPEEQVVEAQDGSTWGLCMWPVAREGGKDLVVMQLRVVTEATARRGSADLNEELRELNERLLVAALQQEDLRERAEAASEAKSRFLATMSHELRTPLNAIVCYEELLYEGITGPVSPEQRSHLNRIRVSAEHLISLIEEILVASRLEAGREIVCRAPVELGKLIEETAAMVSPLAAAKGLNFATNAPDRALVFEGDSVKIRQILVNLLANAVKFSERGDDVVLSTQHDPEWLRFEVTDTGDGISGSDLGRIFEPFWQADQSTTRRSQGAGLGLTVSRQLARLLGGDLTVASVPGEGSTFTLSLPVGTPREGTA